MPLHAWLPRAHPEAPSHVSALMSAAMVNLGVYGIIRVGFGLLGGGSRWWWLLVLALGAVSAVYGILQAAMSTDLKRLLGYSTTENMGLVLVGVGAAGLFAASGHRVLGRPRDWPRRCCTWPATPRSRRCCSWRPGRCCTPPGPRDLDALGGLRTRMPATTAAFGWGALAASALPPGTAFVSEWLLLQALVHGLPRRGHRGARSCRRSRSAAVALTAGLAVATFVKAFGTGFLARPRGDGAAGAAERRRPACWPRWARPGRLRGAGAGAGGLVLPAVAPGGRSPQPGRGARRSRPGWSRSGLAGVTGSMSPLLTPLALVWPC